MSYTVRSGDLWECAAYIALGCKLAGIEPVLVNGRVSCQLTIEGVPVRIDIVVFTELTLYKIRLVSRDIIVIGTR